MNNKKNDEIKKIDRTKYVIHSPISLLKPNIFLHF